MRVEWRKTDMINMAHIRVAGIGGLGLVVVSIGVALFVPSIGIAILISLVLGTVLGVVLIRRRRESGPMPSSGQQPGANVTLMLDAPDSQTPANDPDDPRRINYDAVEARA